MSDLFIIRLFDNKVIYFSGALNPCVPAQTYETGNEFPQEGRNKTGIKTFLTQH